jgi:translation initiation factor IF-3
MQPQLNTLKEELKKQLEDIIQYWIRFTQDEQHGGFWGSINNQNQPMIGSPKGLVLNARILLTFSEASRYLQDEKILSISHRAFRYILDHFHDKEFGGVFWSIDENGNLLGVLSRSEALQAARDAELDLIEISPDADPPVAKIVDWGKYNYQRTKQLQKNKRNAKTSELKQMRFGLKISDHDIGVKIKKVNSFLADGDNVRITVIYRGRELAHREIGYKLMDKLISILGEGIVTEQEPQFAGRQLSIVVRSNSNAKAKNS